MVQPELTRKTWQVRHHRSSSIARGHVGATLCRVLLSTVVLSLTSACVSADRPTVLRPATTDATNRSNGVGPSAIASADIRGPQAPNAVIAYVTDGDTIVVNVTSALEPATTESTDNNKGNKGNNGNNATNRGGATGSQERIRLIGIDTPESKRPNTPIECFATEASHALESLLPKGTPVSIELDVEHRDRYGRLLGYVIRSSDGLFVNHEMVRSGMATALTFPPNIAYSDQFVAAAQGARSNAVGLWSSCDGGHEPLKQTG